MKDEFDTVPSWTVDAIGALGDEYAIPAACRGSGSPDALRWLATRLGLAADTTLIDVGAGMGGAAEFVAAEFGTEVVLAEPMTGACQAARQLFGRPTVAAAGENLPFGPAVFDVAWSLGVVCSSTDQPTMLHELRRVVRADGKIGVLVYIKTVDDLPDQPEGNNFPTRQGLDVLVRDAGMGIIDRADLTDFAAASDWWQERVDTVDDWVAQRHRNDSRWQNATDQESIIGGLIKDELVIGTLLVLEPTPGGSTPGESTPDESTQEGSPQPAV
jgi:ubiquinone/menaquinone biosynthesis C-methylase UbiE